MSKRRSFMAAVFAALVVTGGLLPVANEIAHAAPTVSVAVGDLALTEGDVGSANVKFPFTLSGPAPGPISLTYAVWNGTATSPADFKAETGTVTFSAGQIERETTVKINGDTAVEPNENINIRINSVSGATLGRSWGLIALVDNDANGVSATPEVTAGYPTAQEGNYGNRRTQIPIRLSRPATAKVTVGFNDGCASKNIVFNAGQTIQYADVPVTPDVSPNATYTVPNLYWLASGPAKVPWSYGGLDVRDDDGAAPPVGATVRASETARGKEAQYYTQWGCSDVNPRASDASISANGRYVSFTSQAKNLVPGDTPGFDIYLKDIWTGAIEQVTPATMPSQQYPLQSTVSPDGRLVLYDLMLMPGHQTWGRAETFIYYRVTKATQTLIADDLPGTIYASMQPSISADNRYVAFESEVPFDGDQDPFCPPNPVDNCPTFDVFVRDRVLGTTTLVSKNDDGTPSWGGIPAISADGQHVAYFGPATTPGDSAQTGAAIRVTDLATGHSEHVSVNSAEEPMVGWGPINTKPGISANGQQISFVAEACNLGNACPYGLDRRTSMQVYVRDRSTGTTQVISPVRPSVFQDAAWQSSISADGRYVTFATNDPALIPGCTATCDQERDTVVQRDRLTGTLTRVSQSLSGGFPNDTTTLAGSTFTSADGSYVVYTSPATDIVLRDTGLDEDVFVRRLR